MDDLDDASAQYKRKAKDKEAKEKTKAKQEVLLEKKKQERELKDARFAEVAELLATAVDDQFATVLDLFQPVFGGVSNVFGLVMLRKGLDATKWSLSNMEKLFTSTIKLFCDDAATVATGFLAGGAGSLAEKYAITAAQTPEQKRLDQVKSYARAAITN